MQLSNNVKVGLAVGCFALAMGIMYFTMFKGDGSGGGEPTDITLLCAKCKASYDIKPEAFQKLMESSGINPMMMMGSPGPFACEKCNTKAAWIATKCTKCKNVFMPDMRVQFSDKCPKCGYSEIEQYQKENK